jgi:chromosome segregation ATPase
MAVAEAEEARAKRASLEESIALMDAKRLELEQLEQALVSRHEAVADLTQRLAEGEAKVDEQDRVLRRVHSELLAAEEQAKRAQDRRDQIEQAVEDLGNRQREVEATLQETKLDL